jgi:hypothetical protein
MKQEYIYILVAFTYKQMEAEAKLYAITEPLEKLHHKRRKGEQIDELLEADLRNQIKEFRNSSEYQNIPMGSVNKGFFLTREDAIKVLENYGHSIHEGAYYTHFLIEKRAIGYEGYCFGEDGDETWYKGESIGDGWHDYRYVPCEKPEFFERTVGFA